MKKIILFVACAFTIFFTKTYFFRPIEDRINSAFPISQEIEFLRNDIQTQLTEDKKQVFENTYNNKLKLRALSCSDGYQPSWYASVEKIRLSIQNTSCFNDTDIELKKWMGIFKTGLILAQPPLKAIPKTPIKYILGGGFIRNASFAQNAGVALLKLDDELQVIDIATNNIIFKTTEDRASTGINFLSPNGRLFYTSNQEGIKIRSSENGSLITTLSTGTNAYFSWINNRYGFYSPMSGGKNNAIVVDFSSGKEIALNGIANSGINRAFPIKASNSQFILTGTRDVYKFEINPNGSEVSINLLAEARLERSIFAYNVSSITADGKYLYSAAMDLSLIPVDDFVTKTIKFEPFRIQEGTMTDNPDKIIIRGYIQGGLPTNAGQKYYLYTISDNSLSPITDDKATNNRFIYIDSLNSLGVIKESKIEILDNMALGSPVALNKFVNDAAAEVSLAKLQQLEKQEAFRQGLNYPTQYGAPQRPPRPDADAAIALAPNPRGGVSFGPILNSPAPYAALAKNAQIEAVGVYESENNHKNGDVTIKIQKSLKPIILVLSSYEGVKWHISMMPGAKIATILLSGYEQSEVLGAGSTRITNIGRVYAYENNAYQSLDNEVFKMTGKRIDYFQGRYKGASFSVGGI